MMEHPVTTKLLRVILVLSLLKMTMVKCQIPYGYVDGAKCFRRNCDGTMNCYFRFEVETSYSMSKACYRCPEVFQDCLLKDCIVGGGVHRTLAVINRQLPAPTINVCEGDKVQVLVENKLETGEATSIHWHGQHMRDNPYMDGVPYVTQCPILSGNNMTYTFIAATPGTHFYHSHVEVQRGDGVFGALIVRQKPAVNYYNGKYQGDNHVMVITDWNDRMRIDVFEGYTKAGLNLEPTSILINGYGIQWNIMNTNTPLANFGVTQGYTYRFRVINANFFDCPWEITIDNHKLTVISTDGEDVQQKEVDSIFMSSGERYDFMLKATQPISTYWIRVKGYLMCDRLNTFQLAMLQYKGSTLAVPSGPFPTYATAANTKGVLLNPMTRLESRSVVTVDQLRSVKQLEPGLNNYYVNRFFLSFDMSGIDHPDNNRPNYYGYNQVAPDMRARTAQINHISFKPLDIPLMPARYSISNNQFCNSDKLTSQNCEKSFCECPHVLQVELGEVVELVFLEEADQTDAIAIHPVHFHGNGFRVVTWHEIGANLTRQEIMNNITTYPRNYYYPPIKDTVSVPRGGITIVRFLADNPGYWFLHCHIDIHAVEGMELVIKVGENWEMKDAPQGFPTCGNYPRTDRSRSFQKVEVQSDDPVDLDETKIEE